MATSPVRAASTRGFRTLVAFGSCLSVFWLTSACQTSCENNDQQPIPYKDGIKHPDPVDPAQTDYESTPLDGEWLHFPGYRRFLLYHNLHTMDYTALTMYIAFDSVPFHGDAGDVAIASGDVALIEAKTADTLQIRNDTCSEQYLYVKIVAPTVDADAGDGISSTQ